MASESNRPKRTGEHSCQTPQQKVEKRVQQETHLEEKKEKKLDETGIDPVTYPLRRDHSTI